MTDKMVGAIDKDMQEARNKLKQLNALQKETGLVSSNMNASQKKQFNDIVSYFELSTSKFAANQKEALAMQKVVTDQQGQLSFKQAQKYNNDIKKSMTMVNKPPRKIWNTEMMLLRSCLRRDI